MGNGTVQETRKLKKSERDELAGIVARSTQLGRAALFLVTIAVVAALFRGLFRLASVDAPVWVVPTLIVAYLLYRRAGKWTGGPEFRKLVRRDLEQGEARITVIRPVEVTEVEELEDEGPGYLVKTDDGTWIFFSGQEMLSPKRRGFPWSEFGAVEAPHSGVFFGLKRMGDSIPVERTIPPLPYELVRDLGAFQRTMVLLDDNARSLIDTAAGMRD